MDDHQHPCAAAARPPRCRGFTLLELLVCLALAVIVLTSVVPALGTTINRNRLLARTHEFFTYLMLTRAEAIRSGNRAVLCPSQDGESCWNSNRWHRGWIVFLDHNHNGRRDASERVLRRHDAVADVTIQSGTRRRRLTFLSTGASYGSNTTIAFCPRTAGVSPFAIVLSNPGRPRISHTRPGGGALNCPD